MFTLKKKNPMKLTIYLSGQYITLCLSIYMALLFIPLLFVTRGNARDPDPLKFPLKFQREFSGFEFVTRDMYCLAFVILFSVCHTPCCTVIATIVLQ